MIFKKQRILRITRIIWTACLFMECSCEIVSADLRTPFYPGEQLCFSLRWEFAPAGRAVFNVLPPDQPGTGQTMRFRLEVETNSFVDMFYKIREQYQSITDLGLTRSLRYEVLSGGTHPKNITVDFDWKACQALFSNFGQPGPAVDMNNPSFDPLGAIYKLRVHQLAPHGQIRLYITDGRKAFLQTAYIEKQETVTVPAGTFETFVLIPELTHFGGVFKKSVNPKLKIWVTTDHRHMPVKIRSRVLIGSVVAELVSFKI